MHSRVGLLGIVHGFEVRVWTGLELHRLRNHHDEVLHSINGFGIDVGGAGVGQSVLHLELGLSRPKREDESVAILF